MESKRFPAVGGAALVLFVLTGIAPWLHGTWAVGRFPALCLSPGAAVLLWCTREVWRHPARALAGSILGSAVLTPATLFPFLRILGSPDRALVASSLLWGLVLAAAFLGRHGVLRAQPKWRSSRRDLLFVAGASLLIVLPLFLNRDLRLRSDAWTHIALVREILNGRYPWIDPRFAGEQLRYFWFYNLWSAGFSAREGLSIPLGLTLTNLASTLGYAAAVLAMAQRFFPHRAGRAAAIGVSFAGLNPFGLLAYPVKLATALVGRTRGMDQVKEMLAPPRFLSAEVADTLTPYGTSFVAWIDKYLVITAFGLAMAAATFLFMLVWEGMRERKMSAENLVLLAIGYAALLFHHLVAAVFTEALLAGSLLLTKGAGRLKLSWRDILLVFGVLGAITLAAIPYLSRIVFGGSYGGGGSYGLGLERLWINTTGTAVGPLILLLILGWGRLALAVRGGRHALAVFLGLAILLMLIVRMPTVNENKMIILFFCMTAPFGADGVLRLGQTLGRRTVGRVLGFGLTAGACLVPALLWVGTLLHHDPPISPGVAAACEWLRREAPREAMLIEPPGRRLILNLAERDMFVSEFPFVIQCGYPREEMAERIALVDRIYARGRIDEQQAAMLSRMHRPVYVFYEDVENGGRALPVPSPDQFEPVFLRGKTAVYRWTAPRSEMGSADEDGMSHRRGRISG